MIEWNPTDLSFQSQVSFKRVRTFLLCEELEGRAVDDETAICNAVEIDDGTFCWTNGEPPFLRDISISVPRGSLVAVVGRVGSGKSALFSAILGEMHATEGAVRIMKGGRLAYVSQQAWIQNTTVRQNILFVKPMDKKSYNSALSTCCLKPDIKILPGGDLTEIGEKGVNLSGGQKQRVSLARAVYQDADIYLLDDPLSAVDSHVGSHIFKHVIGPEGVLQNKTRILATHDFSVLQEVDKIYLMSEGRVLESGSYQELLDQKGEFARLIEEYLKKQIEDETKDESDDEKRSSDTESSSTKKLSTEDLKAQMQRLGSRLSRTISRTISLEEKDPKKVRFIEKEKMEIGRVKASIFWIYFRYATVYLAFLFILGFATSKAFDIGSNVWLSKWSSDPPLPDGTQNIPLRNLRMGIYGLIGLAQSLSTLAGMVILAIAATRASIRFHKSMLWSVLRSPMEFFDTTPMGRILNRFGKDINCVDFGIPSRLQSLIAVTIGVVGSFMVIIITHPIFIVLMIPLCVIYIFVQCFYMASSRQIRRLQSVTLSPVLSFFSETVQGSNTIRAYGAQYEFIDKQDKHIDTNCRVFYSNTLLNRWLGIRLQFLGNTVVFITALLCVIERRAYSAAIVGLTLTYALNVTDSLATFVRLFTQVENQMVSVERIHEYSDLPSEASWKTESIQFSREDWPNRGVVSFRDYKMRYRTGMDLVLKGINVEIASGQKHMGADKTCNGPKVSRISTTI
ncbi:multidrug resistance-associated protein 1 [Nephila pilipes]|uniref:ABC-type glutathione-S-conjugate transporter n=1 Tax=Nephila pilipes TaxID=299642 RepID=A0A8X6NUT7_NEPPI|nr:multidrug resistance-associated protein 1 [Nephila pilipes]